MLVPKKLDIREFVNADEIARGLSPFNSEEAAMAAGRTMVERMRFLAREGRSFAFETTGAGRAHAGFLRRRRDEGWRVTLVFLWLPSPTIALDRVARRVAQGGHDVPADVVVRRYWAGLANLHRLYLPLADVVAIYDNADDARVLIAERTPPTPLVVHDAERWVRIERATK